MLGSRRLLWSTGKFYNWNKKSFAGLEQAGIVAVSLPMAGGGSGWGLRSLPAQTILLFHEKISGNLAKITLCCSLSPRLESLHLHPSSWVFGWVFGEPWGSCVPIPSPSPNSCLKELWGCLTHAQLGSVGIPSWILQQGPNKHAAFYSGGAF